MSTSYAKQISDASPFADAHALARQTEQEVSSEAMLRSAHQELEALCEKRGREFARLMLQANLQLRARAETRVEVVGADERERNRARDSARRLRTVVGDVCVWRLAYQAPEHLDLHPMDATLNLPPQMYSYGVRRMVAKKAARASYEEVVEHVAEYSGASCAKRQAEELAIATAFDFEDFYAQRKGTGEATDDVLVISTDGKGIVMRPEDLRDATKAAAARSTHKLQTRLSPGEKANRKRMAQVAAVYGVAAWPRKSQDIVHTMRRDDVEAKRPKVHHKRVWASVTKGVRAVVREAFEEALRRDPEQKRRWVVLVDGEPRQLRAIKAEVRRLGIDVTILLDVVHVLEYLWKAARALFGSAAPKAEEWVGDRLLALLDGQTGGQVAQRIRWWAKHHADALDAPGREAIRTACRYLADRTRTRLMKYADALRDGLPIATGVIEGACRYLVKDRMDRTGARWSLRGAEAVLRLRALVTCGDFEDYWRFHLAREHDRNHAPLYADGAIPEPLPVRNGHLRRVK
jgi:hypothetical protein